MKTEKKGVEGQLDIFEAMNRAADAIDRMVEEDQKKKKTSGNKTESGEKSAKAVTGQKKNKEDKIIRGCDMHASMQKAAGIAEETTEQEPFSDVKYLSDNIYAECEE